MRPALVVVAFTALGGCHHEEHERGAYRRAHAAAGAHANGAAAPSAAKEFPVPPPPFTEGVFPCMDCHAETEPDPTPRELSEHDGIKLQHGPREGWCYECHNPANRDVLRLASGTLVPFAESYRLCGQCHGDKYRDWRVGVHGRRTGEWDGKKQYLLCIHCHNPHSPSFKPVKPLPPPARPSELQARR